MATNKNQKVMALAGAGLAFASFTPQTTIVNAAFTVYGTNAIASSDNALVVDVNSEASGMASTVLGNEAKATGVNDTDAVNVSQLKDLKTKLQASSSPDMDIDWSLINTTESTVAEEVKKSTVLGGTDNLIKGNNDIIAGGNKNTVSGTESGVFVGYDNVINTGSINSAIVGGMNNIMDAGTENSVISGGQDNLAKGHNNDFIGGGCHNTVEDDNGVIVGGEDNLVSETSAAVIGGIHNTAEGTNSAVIAGNDNLASGADAVIIGGKGNSASGDESAVIGGQENSATGVNAVAIGGVGTKANKNNTIAMAGGIADGKESIAIKGATASQNAIAIGSGTAVGANSVMVGQNGVAGAESTTAIGPSAMATGEYDTVIGNKATAMYGHSVAVGNNAQTAGQGSIAIGHGATTHNENAVALGAQASATNIRSVAIGEGSHAYGNNALALGYKSHVVSSDDVAIGTNSTANGANSIAIGKDSTAWGDAAIVIGNAAEAFEGNSIVIGNNTSTRYIDGDGNTHHAKNSVALGSSSVVDEDNSVSVGSNGQTRKITHITAGVNNTDAVNVSQLESSISKAVNGFDAKLENKANISLDNISKEGENVIKELSKQVDTTAKVEASDKNLDVKSTKDGNITTYDVTMNRNLDIDSLTVGGKTYVTDAGLNANNQRITNVANGVNDNDAVNMAQLREVMSSNSGNPLAVEYDAMKKNVVTLRGEKGTTITNVNDGKLSADSKDAVNGSQLHTTNQKVDQNATDIKNLRQDVNQNIEDIKRIRQNVENNSTTINQNSKDVKELKDADELNVKYSSEIKDKIILGGNGGTTIKNVAAATHDDEAVNLKQLNDSIGNVIAKGDKNTVRYTDDIHKKAVLDGAGGTTLTGVADGVVTKGSQDAVNGGQLYNEEQARKNANKELEARIGWLDSADIYNVIHAGDSVFENIKALDGAINNSSLVKDDGKEITIAKNSNTKVINVAGKNGENRVITGVQTNPNDGTNAANVDYVNNQTKKSQEYANGISAQAAAMASLHPLDWEKNDKVSVAASVGAYKSEVAGAIGAYYRPDKKSMLSFQTSFGSNDNMFGIGVSKKFGKGSPDNEEITQEEAVALRNEVTELRTKNDSLETKYQQLEAQNKKIIELLSNQNGLSAATVVAILNPTHEENTAVNSGSEAEPELTA